MFNKKPKENELSENQVWESLKKVKYPGMSRDIVSFGMVKTVSVNKNIVSVSIQISTQNTQVGDQISQSINEEIRKLPNVADIKIDQSIQAPAERGVKTDTQKPDKKNLTKGIRNIIAVASGKGGVGKSTISVNLAAALKKDGQKVGLFDCDIYGPSIPMMMGVDEKQTVLNGEKIMPIESFGIKLMSIGFFVPKDTPLIWRGPMIQKSVEQMLGDVEWGELDYLIIDLPPGTGDAQLSLAQLVSLDGAVIVTTPQDISLIDAVKGVMMFKKINVPIVGIIENMSYFKCPHCNEETDIFARGGGLKESQRLDISFLGEVPLISDIRKGGDEGKPWVFQEHKPAEAEVFIKLAQNVIKSIQKAEHPENSDLKINIV